MADTVSLEEVKRAFAFWAGVLTDSPIASPDERVAHYVLSKLADEAVRLIKNERELKLKAETQQ